MSELAMGDNPFLDDALWCLSNDSGMDAQEKITYLYLKSRIEENGEVSRSVNEIAISTGLSSTTIKRCTKSLVAKGAMVCKVRRYNREGPQANIYGFSERAKKYVPFMEVLVARHAKANDEITGVIAVKCHEWMLVEFWRKAIPVWDNMSRMVRRFVAYYLSLEKEDAEELAERMEIAYRRKMSEHYQGPES